MPSSNVSALLSSGVSVGILAGVVSGLFYLVVAGFRWAGEVRLYSSEWFQKQLRRHFTSPVAGDNTDRSDGSIMESESSRVREFIERLVEKLVDGGLDHVNVNRLYSHPEYKPLDVSDSPSVVHAELKQLVERVIHEAMALPALHKGLQNRSAKVKDDINAKTYEDILATAILNKVIERFQLSRIDTPEGIDTNSNLLFKNRNMEQQSFINCVEYGVVGAHPTTSSIDDTSPCSLDDASWSGSSHTEPTSLTVEECIEEEEEVTTYDSSEDADDDPRKTTGAELDFYLSGLNFIKRHRVPFPELGMDIVDGSEELEDNEEATSPLPTDLISPVDSWEENWLFQRRRLKVGGSHQPMPVPMLVPNPSEDYRALIGDQDAEETSDLSDCSEGIYEDVLYPNEGSALRSSLEATVLLGQRERDVTRDEYSSLTDTTAEIAEARNAELSNSLDSSSELCQQDSEYTEDYASVTQRQMGSLTRQHSLTSTPVPKPRRSIVSDQFQASTENTKTESDDTSSSIPHDESVLDYATPPRPGTIAEREHRKWESAPPLPNNPYSSENILKRLNKSSLLYIRTNSQDQMELPDNIAENKKEKLSGQSQSNANISRYGRDYYVNASKVSSGSFAKAYARPVEIVMSPTVDQPITEIIEKSKSTPKEVEELQPCVGSKVSRWQKEINGREELWLKNNTNKSDTDLKTINKLEEKTNGQSLNGKSTLLKSEHVPIQEPRQTKLESSTHKNCKNSTSNGDTNKNNLCKDESVKSKVPNNNVPAVVCKTSISCDAKKNLNGEVKHKSNGTANGNISSGSSVVESDNEIIAMPSVKDLAKQFTSRTKKPTPPESPVSRQPNGVAFPSMGVRKNVSSLTVTEGQPLREVHSLTARSISRVFREELKHNLPTQLDRNTRGSASSLLNSSDSSHASPSQRSSSDVDSSITPGYTSDESGTTSPTPGSLRNNIAFWEQIQHK